MATSGMSFFGISEGAWRLVISLCVFGAMALWELSEPFRETKAGRPLRWSANLGLMLIDTALVRLVFPLAAVGVALWAEARGFGLFNWLGWNEGAPGFLAGLIAFFALDCLIYWQHRIFHRVPMLWRLHRVHHSDTELDVTSGVRFHPVEILLSMGIKSAAIILLGAPALAVILFEAVLNATSLFNHGNVRLGRIEPLLRKVLVTPEMHRVHHSILREETDSNYGFNFAFWDRLFGSYRAEPKAGPEGVTLGLEEFREREEQRLDRLLIQPVKRV
jgi:sterol desaturase/sphingolipid hydroxylase (fatty acid hydroxylase superfamily)